MKTLLTILLISIAGIASGQVGVGTTNPQEMLHVDGAARVDSLNTTTATGLVGMDDDNTLNEVNVGYNLNLSAGTLNAYGSNTYFVGTVTVSTSFSNQQFDNVDIGLDGANENITVFRIVGSTNNFAFSGLDGGTDGRHIVLLNIEPTNFRVNNQDTDSDPENRFITLSGGFEATSGQGAVELVYDGILQRWIVINFRN